MRFYSNWRCHLLLLLLLSRTAPQNEFHAEVYDDITNKNQSWPLKSVYYMFASFSLCVAFEMTSTINRIICTQWYIHSLTHVHVHVHVYMYKYNDATRTESKTETFIYECQNTNKQKWNHKIEFRFRERHEMCDIFVFFFS